MFLHDAYEKDTCEIQKDKRKRAHAQTIYGDVELCLKNPPPSIFKV